MAEWSCDKCGSPVVAGASVCGGCGRTMAGIPPGAPSLGLAVVALLLNFAVLPGLGSVIVGRMVGLLQMVIAAGDVAIAFASDAPGPFAAGILLWFGAWVSGLVVGAKAIDAAADRIRAPPSPS